MGVISSLLLPLIVYILIFLNGIGETITGGMSGTQEFDYPRRIESRRYEIELTINDSYPGSRARSNRIEQMRYNQMVNRQTRRVRSRRTWR